AAAAKAKAAALAKQKRTEGEANSESTTSPEETKKEKEIAIAKAKAAAATKAKAAALAKQKRTEGDTESTKPLEETEKAKAKAIAVAKAKAAAAAKTKSKLAEKTSAPASEEAPSPNQSLLDTYRTILETNIGPEILEDAYINRLSKDVPTIVLKKEAYYRTLEFLRKNEQLKFNYLSEIHGTDFVTHFEVYLYLYSFPYQREIVIKVKVDREQPELESVVPLWIGANWAESEIYDLLGITFTAHPNLERILLGEDWVGHPLRKDYEQYDDVEV
ncbi:NADH-quinone oxidoreductase subunit C, partial [Bacillus sp. FJAT-27986]|uniref:NADH-quinone oxidoreductase subunit C n=1 Tax=Bacillus sp. FJAT-27986 TaxID=1743146 RepID=UPI00080ADED5